MEARIEARIEALCPGFAARPGSLLLILRGLQQALGCVPPDYVPSIARLTNLSRAEVHGVISFYHEFRDRPAGRHTVRICQAEACQSMGSVQLTAHALKRAGTGINGTTADGRLTIEPVYCLGNCACSPAVMIDGDLHGRVSAARFDELIAELT